MVIPICNLDVRNVDATLVQQIGAGWDRVRLIGPTFFGA